MQCPQCKADTLQPTKTKQGVDIDYCSKCGGIWLDQGKVFKFHRQPQAVAVALKAAAAKAKPSSRKSPKSQETLQDIPLLGEQLVVGYCPKSGGLWFDNGKLTTLSQVTFRHSGSAPPQPGAAPAGPGSPTTPAKTVRPESLPALPDLRKTRNDAFAALYCFMVFMLAVPVVAGWVNWSFSVVVAVAVVLAQFAGTAYFLDSSLHFLLPLEWIQTQDLPPHLAELTDRVCKKHGLESPEFGLLFDRSPVIFTYGRGKKPAKIVLSKGLLSLLDRSEQEAVLAHELGHLCQSNVVPMTAAQLFPFFLANVFYAQINMPGEREKPPAKGAKGKKPAESQPEEMAPPAKKYQGAFFTHALFFLAQLFFLPYSRARELHADRFAAETTGKPNVLATALLKMHLGCGGIDKEVRTILWCDACQTTLQAEQIYEGLCRVCDRPVTKKEVKREKRTGVLDCVGAFGVLDPVTAKSFAAVACALTPQGDFFDGRADLKKILLHWVQWEMENPWARYYEFFSSHPLLCKRLTYLGAQAEVLGQTPLLKVDLRRVEGSMLFSSSPVGASAMRMAAAPVLWLFVGIPALLFFNPWILGGLFILTGLLSFVAARQAYPVMKEDFPDRKIADLVRRNDTAHFRPEPCKITGRILGVGERKPFAQQEFLMRDDTGAVPLDCRLPLRVWEFVFSPLRGKELAGVDARLTGWFRRVPVPYVEIETLKIGNDTLVSSVRKYRAAWAAIMVLAGLFCIAMVVF